MADEFMGELAASSSTLLEQVDLSPGISRTDGMQAPYDLSGDEAF